MPAVQDLRTLLAGAWSYGQPLLLIVGGLLALAVRPAWARLLPWGIATLLVYTLPFGEGVAVGQHALPSAFRLLRELIPLFHRLTWPSRMAIAPMLGLACTAAVASAWLHGRAAAWPLRQRATWALCTVLLLVGLAERSHSCHFHGYILRAKPAPLQAADFYRQVARATDGGIVDIPVLASNAEYVYQMVHHQPILGGPGIDGPNTMPPQHRAFVEGNSFLKALEQVALGQPEPPWDRADREALKAAGFTVVIVHEWKEEIDAKGVEDMLGEPILHGHRRTVFSLEEGRPARRGKRPGRMRRP